MKLTDTQRALLEAAAQHPQKKLTNFPDTLKGGARIKVLTSMHNAALIGQASQSLRCTWPQPQGCRLRSGRGCGLL
jgi:hypothetical protein